MITKTPRSPDLAFAALKVMAVLGIPAPPMVESDEHALDQNGDGDKYDEYKVEECEIQALVNDRQEFQRLKLSLKAKGAVTNEILRQRLHVYVYKNRSRLQSISRSHCEDNNSNLTGSIQE